MTLFINACVRTASRTKQLADCLLSKLGGPYTEVRLEEIAFPITDTEFLDKRDRLIAAGDYSDPIFALAKQFAAADKIVIAAPFWDLSFPASLKQYFEHINALGVTFSYTPEGIPKGLCKAEKIYYVTTAGGNYVPEEYGFVYVKALAQGYYGIMDVKLIQAIGLDLIGANAEQILRDCMERIPQIL